MAQYTVTFRFQEPFRIGPDSGDTIRRDTFLVRVNPLPAKKQGLRLKRMGELLALKRSVAHRRPMVCIGYDITDGGAVTCVDFEFSTWQELIADDYAG